MRSDFTPSLAGSRQWADRFGVWTSALCVVHCLLTPVLISFSAVFAHFLSAEERAHRSLALLVALFGVTALFIGFRKHRRRSVLLMMSLGLSCIGGAAWFGNSLPSHAVEVAITFCGSGLMIAAHRLNHTFCKSCECASKL
ncbi:MerC domain-containing protein [Granulicella aggregans]|uniref:MerC domain-containing protein n=1 Tax=Granulicella aggregans TaxID=474949 RepID=UPI0021E0A941|nr:MerC domain-containing protein [Granulicella aggregans]